MSEYIDRESIRKVLMDVCSDENCPMFIAATIDQVIDYEPAADVAPVVYGKWILDAKNHCHCSRCLCGRNIETQIGWNYCPACGVKMILEDD